MSYDEEPTPAPRRAPARRQRQAAIVNDPSLAEEIRGLIGVRISKHSRGRARYLGVARSRRTRKADARRRRVLRRTQRASRRANRRAS